jgi:hypothetical protein
MKIMNAVTLLDKQLANINAIFHSLADDLTDQEWITRPAPGQNRVAYLAWHLPRVQDSHIHTWVRGIPEVVHGDRWSQWGHLRRFGNGIGITLAEADEVALSVRRDDVLAYADAVYSESSAWLDSLSDVDLDRIPDTRLHLSPYPEYQTPGFYEEVSSLLDQPIWSQLMRPCIGHIHRHLGELELVKAVLRASDK